MAGCVRMGRQLLETHVNLNSLSLVESSKLAGLGTRRQGAPHAGFVVQGLSPGVRSGGGGDANLGGVEIYDPN